MCRRYYPANIVKDLVVLIVTEDVLFTHIAMPKVFSLDIKYQLSLLERVIIATPSHAEFFTQ